MQRLDAMLAELETREPQMLNTVQSRWTTRTRSLSANANAEFSRLSTRIDALTNTLQVALNQGSANLVDLSQQLDHTVRRNSGHVDAIVASLDASARDLNRTADQVTALASDPQLRSNILQTTQGIAQTATTFSSIASDLHSVTGNPQTQAQIRDTVANVGRRLAEGQLDPGPVRRHLERLRRRPRRDARAGRLAAAHGTYPQRPGAGAPRPGGSPAPGTIQSNVKNKVGTLVRQLVALQIRVAELDRQHAGSASSPLLTRDRGPQTDVNVIALPRGPTYLYAGANDIGGPASSTQLRRHGDGQARPAGRRRGALLPARRARRVRARATGKGFSLEARVYDLRRPTTDAYANFSLGNGLTLFGGERDLLRDGRRTTFGLQYQF